MIKVFQIHHFKEFCLGCPESRHIDNHSVAYRMLLIHAADNPTFFIRVHILNCMSDQHIISGISVYQNVILRYPESPRKNGFHPGGGGENIITWFLVRHADQAIAPPFASGTRMTKIIMLIVMINFLISRPMPHIHMYRSAGRPETDIFGVIIV